MSLDRVSEVDEVSRIASLAIQVLTIQPKTGFDPQALVTVSTGLGEKYRVVEPIDLWQRAPGEYRHLLITGNNARELCHEPMTFEVLRKSPYNLYREENVHLQLTAENTPDQTNWIIRTALEHEISSFYFFAPTYHMVRAYLTLLKSALKVGAGHIVMIPIPLTASPDFTLLQTGVTIREMIPAEIVRIPKYQQLGDVATLPELEEYLNGIQQYLNYYSDNY